MRNPTYEKLENESDYEYGLRLISIKIEEKPDDLDWSDIVELLNLDCHKDSLRKAAAVTDFCGYKVMQYFKDKQVSGANNDDDYLKELGEKKRELIKERRKLATEKIEYNRWLRNDARDELFEEKVIKAIVDNIGKVSLPKIVQQDHSQPRSGVLNIADCHFGKDFKIYGLNNEVINSYSPEIFFDRMDRLLGEVIVYARKENLNNLKVFNLGDSLDGFLRNSQIWTLRYGVIESAIKYGEYMGRWLQALSNEFQVEYYQTCGNHGELRLLDGLKNQHKRENIEIITGNFIRLINKDNPNFRYIDNKTGYIFTQVSGYNIIGIHGEVKDLPSAISEYSNIYDTKIDYLICGHTHFAKYENCGVRRGVIGVGSIMGADDYSMFLRKISDATASFVIFEKGKGKTDEHTFVLN